MIYFSLGRTLMLLGRDTEAIDWLERALRANADRASPPPDLFGQPEINVLTNMTLAATSALTGQLDDAHARLASAMSSIVTMDSMVRLFLNAIPSYYDPQRQQQERRLGPAPGRLARIRRNRRTA